MENMNQCCCNAMTNLREEMQRHSDDLHEIWESLSQLRGLQPEYPTLMPGVDWIPGSLSTIFKRSTITAIRFVDSVEEPIENAVTTYNAGVVEGTITAYLVGTELIVVGNGSGKIRMNPSSRGMFGNMKNLEHIEGLELLDASQVTSLSGAFNFCHKLVDVDLSMWSLPLIQTMDGMFNECNLLETVKMPRYGSPTSTISIFMDSPQIREVEFGKGLTILSQDAFRNCSALERVTGLEDVTTIGASAFKGCTALKRVTDLNSVTTIGEAAFCDCVSLRRVESLEKVTTIGDSAFYGCTALEEVGSLNSVTTIGASAFRECCALEQVTGLDNVTTIGDYTFCRCFALREVGDLSKVTTVGAFAFCSTPRLTSINLQPENIATIGASAFRLSAVEDAVDFTEIPLECIGAHATRRKRWSDTVLAEIKAIPAVDSYYPVPNPDSQLNYEDMVYAREYDDAGNVIQELTVKDTGCGALTLYHIWQHLHRGTTEQYPDFRTWFTDKINHVFTIGGDMVSHVTYMIEKLGWERTNTENGEYYICGSDYKQQIVDWLRDRGPVYASMHSVNHPDAYHVIAIIGSNSDTGKLAILDSGIGTTGVISWVAFEDIFTEAGYIGSQNENNDLEYMYLIDFNPDSTETQS